jgi:Ribbon-Helix-Helix transcriptional regulator family
VLRIGIQTITAHELEQAARRGRKVHAVVVGWAHLSRRVTPALADRALGHIVTVGPRTGFRRVQR